MRAPHCVLAALLATLAACGPPSPADRPSNQPPVGSRQRAAADLELSVENVPGIPGEATLRCTSGADLATGYLRMARAADLCRRLADAGPVLTSAPPRDRVCAQVYGGPATARIRGTFDGRRVERRLTRTDACQISDWDRLGELLPDAE